MLFGVACTATFFFQFLLSLPVQRVMGSLAQYCSHHSFFQLKFYLKIIGCAHATVISNTERCHIPCTQSPSVVTSHLNWQIDTGRVQILTVQSSGGFLMSATAIPSLPPSLSRGKCSRLPQKAGVTLDLQIQDRDSGESCQPSSLGGPALLSLRTNHTPSYIRHHCILTRWEADSLISTRFLHDRVSGIFNLTTQTVREDDRARTRVSTSELFAPLDSTYFFLYLVGKKAGGKLLMTE